jgi:hypothetical protein
VMDDPGKLAGVLVLMLIVIVLVAGSSNKR